MAEVVKETLYKLYRVHIGHSLLGGESYCSRFMNVEPRLREVKGFS